MGRPRLDRATGMETAGRPVDKRKTAEAELQTLISVLRLKPHGFIKKKGRSFYFTDSVESFNSFKA